MGDRIGLSFIWNHSSWICSQVTVVILEICGSCVRSNRSSKNRLVGLGRWFRWIKGSGCAGDACGINERISVL